MANYVKGTNFAVKDGLLTGDPLKIVSGTEIDDEFNAIQVAVNTKADTNSPALTGVPTAPTAGAGVSTSQIATTAYVQNNLTPLATILAAVYPVGSIYINATNNTNPATLLGFGTWVAFGAGRVPVGFNASDSLFDAAEKTGGSKDAIVVEHTHNVTGTTNTTGNHTHTAISSPSGNIITGANFQGGQGFGFNTPSGAAGNHSHTVTGTATSTGSSATNANVQPYITVYMWKRVS